MIHLKKFNENYNLRHLKPNSDNVFFMPKSAKEEIEDCLSSLKDLYSEHKIEHGWIKGVGNDLHFNDDSYDAEIGKFVNTNYVEGYEIHMYNPDDDNEMQIGDEVYLEDLEKIILLSNALKESHDALNKIKNLYNYKVYFRSYCGDCINIIICANKDNK